MKRDDVVEIIRESGEIIEQALPVGSSVLKDQLTLMVAGQLMHEKSLLPMMAMGTLGGMFGEGSVALGLTRLAMETDKERVWETYCYFVRQLTQPEVTEEEFKRAFKDEREEEANDG